MVSGAQLAGGQRVHNLAHDLPVDREFIPRVDVEPHALIYRSISAGMQASSLSGLKFYGLLLIATPTGAVLTQRWLSGSPSVLASSGSAGSASGKVSAGSVCDGATRALTPVKTPIVGTIATFDDMALAPFTSYSSSGTADFRVKKLGANTTIAAARVTSSGAKEIAAFLFSSPCTDVSALDGIVLWAKSDTKTTLAVGFSTPELLPVQYGGDCLGNCYNFHTVWLALTPEWRFFAVPFAKAERPSWAPPLAWRDLIMGLDLGMNGAKFDVQIDEVSFYAGQPPQAAELPP